MVDNAITYQLDAAVAGTQAITSDSNITLTVTNGDTAGTNLAQVGAGTTGSAQYAIIRCTGARTAQRTITAPAASKAYTVINATTGGFSIKVVGVGPTTGVLVAPGEIAQIAWNGSDFVKLLDFTQLASSISGTNIDLSLGSYFYKTISANTTFTLTNVPASGTVASVYLELTNAGAYTTVFWSGVKWANNVPITLSALGTDLLQFISRDGGTTWEASKIGSYGAYTLNPALNANGNLYGSGTNTVFVLGDSCAYGPNGDVARYTSAASIPQATGWTYAPALRNLMAGNLTLSTGAATASTTVLVDTLLRVYVGNYTSWAMSSSLLGTAWGSASAATCAVYATTPAKWVIGGVGGRIAYSSDGYIWTYTTTLSATTFGTSQDVVALVYIGGSGNTVAIGSTGGVAVSTDGGVTWTYNAGLLTAWTSGVPVAATITSTGTIMVAGQSGKFATSTDGVTWTNQAALAASTWGATNPAGKFSIANTQVAATGYVMLVAANGTIASSADNGVTWTANTTLQTALGGTTPLTFSGNTGLFIPATSYSAVSSTVVFAYGTLGSAAYTSDGGTTWSVVGGPAQTTTQFFSKIGSVQNYVNNVVWNGTLFMAVGSYAAATSYDGVNWTTRATGLRTKYSANGVASSALYSAAYGAGTWVVGAYNSRLFTSTDDGATWTYQNGIYSINATSTLYGVAYGNSRFVAVSNNGRTFYSTDGGVTWALVASGVAITLNAITYGNSKFVTGGVSGSLLTSPDGITWTNYTSTITATTFGTNTITGIAWSGTKFVVVGGTGQALTSPDGITWTYQGGLVSVLTEANSSIYSVTWTGAEFVAVGGTSSAIVATSPDGITWTNRTAQVPQVPGGSLSVNSNVLPALNTLRAVASNGNTLVVGGDRSWLITR